MDLTLSLFVFMCLLQLGDMLTTKYALTLPGAEEKNPVLKWLFGEIGLLPALVIAKVFFIGLVWFFAYNTMVLGIICVAYSLVVAWNLYMIKLLKATENSKG